jgi:hypothetical protein
MMVRLKPLGGKYYGTIIEFVDGPLVGNLINVWMRDRNWGGEGMEPSDRELAYREISREEYERLYHADCDSTPIDISGGHYESRETFAIAHAIVEALNSSEQMADNQGQCIKELRALIRENQK